MTIQRIHTGERMRGLWILALALLSSFLPYTTHALTTSMKVEVQGSQIIVDGKPFFIRGVMYSPSPIGSHPGWTWPYGDFFIPQYSNLWDRDFPLLKELGANTVRITGWNDQLDHGYFLDQAHRAGLKVIVTFGLGNVWQNPIHEEWQRQQILGRFTWQFRKYLNHPALLAWSFGEQLNLPANGFLQGFSDARSCPWNGHDFNADGIGCFNNPDPHSSCAGSISCVYEGFFGFLNEAASYAKNIMQDSKAHLIISSLSDVDLAWKRTRQFAHLAQNLDGWGLQIYRGKDFGKGKEDFLTNYETATEYNAAGQKNGTPKPLIVVEYGVDAYNDPCGTSDETVSALVTRRPCYNDVSSSEEDESSQADWGSSLAKHLEDHSSATGKGSVAGGTINSFIDEAWRCTSGVGGCFGPIPYPLPGFDASQCSWKAHVQCPQLNLWRRSLCGYYTPAAPDHYANVGWFGLLRNEPSAGDIDRLTPRLIYGKLQQLWRVDRQNEWGWIGLLVGTFAIATFATYHTHSEWTKRTAQVRSLESKAMESASRSSGGGTSGRSPLLVSNRHQGDPQLSPKRSPKSERRGSRSREPLGKSSRAVGAGGSGYGSTGSTASHTPQRSPEVPPIQVAGLQTLQPAMMQASPQ